MLFSYFDLLTTNPLLAFRLIAATVFALLSAVTVHEASHALIAYWQGDPTARTLGRLSLNPIRHLDPMGTLMMLFVGFGWGKPVPVNPYRLRDGVKVGGALVSLAGPASNLLAATVVALPVRLGLMPWHSPLTYSPFSQLSFTWILADVMGLVVFYNLVLAIFNLLPIAPLDGFKVALGVLPNNLAYSFARLEPYGPGILMSIILLSYLPMINFSLWDILGPVLRVVSLVVVGRAL